MRVTERSKLLHGGVAFPSPPHIWGMRTNHGEGDDKDTLITLIQLYSFSDNIAYGSHHPMVLKEWRRLNTSLMEHDTHIVLYGARDNDLP